MSRTWAAPWTKHGRFRGKGLAMRPPAEGCAWPRSCASSSTSPCAARVEESRPAPAAKAREGRPRSRRRRWTSRDRSPPPTDAATSRLRRRRAAAADAAGRADVPQSVPVEPPAAMEAGRDQHAPQEVTETPADATNKPRPAPKAPARQERAAAERDAAGPRRPGRLHEALGPAAPADAVFGTGIPRARRAAPDPAARRRRRVIAGQGGRDARRARRARRDVGGCASVSQAYGFADKAIKVRGLLRRPVTIKGRGGGEALAPPRALLVG